MNDDTELRQQLLNLLTVRQAHMDFEDAVADFPAAHINTRPPHCTYTCWHLVEHLRICQRDILDYIVADDYAWPAFPEGLWPEPTAVATLTDWHDSVARFLADRQRLVEIVQDTAVDLFAPVPNSGDLRHTIVREIHVVASHNAYHTGELGILRQTLDLWP